MKQHDKPCKGCPFNRNVKPGELGGSSPEVYVGQLMAPFWLPCHEDPDYKGKASHLGEVTQCAGAALVRANMGIDKHMPDALLHLKKDGGLGAFYNVWEFYAHHTGMKLEDTFKSLSDDAIKQYVMEQLQAPELRIEAVEKEGGDSEEKQ